MPIKKAIYSNISDKFDCCTLDTAKAFNTVLTYYFGKMQITEEINLQVLRDTVDKIIVSKDGTITVRFINGAEIESINEKINYIGSTNWQSQGDKLSWKINVEQEGLYALSFKFRQKFHMLVAKKSNIKSNKRYHIPKDLLQTLIIIYSAYHNNAQCNKKIDNKKQIGITHSAEINGPIGYNGKCQQSTTRIQYCIILRVYISMQKPKSNYVNYKEQKNRIFE